MGLFIERYGTGFEKMREKEKTESLEREREKGLAGRSSEVNDFDYELIGV